MVNRRANIGLVLKQNMLKKENLWIEWGYRRWITDMEDKNVVSTTNSIQSGIMLRADFHQEFDRYLCRSIRCELNL